MTEPQNLLHFALITALPLEVLAAINIFDTAPDVYVHNTRVFHVGKIFDPSTNTSYSGVVTVADYYGASAAAAVTTELRILFNPRYYFLVGIAGAISNDVGLGDIVVSDSIVEIFFQKIFPQGLPEERIRRHEVCTPLVKKAEEIKASQFVFSECNPKMPEQSVNIHIGQFVSSNAVIASSDARKELQKNYRHALAVEMEAQGVAHALQDSRHSPTSHFIVVKAISDLADDLKTDTIWRELGACTSVNFVKSLIMKTDSISSEFDKSSSLFIRPAKDFEAKRWLGDQYHSWGKYDLAHQYYQQAYYNAIDLGAEVNIVLKSAIAHDLAVSHHRRGNLAQADEMALISHELRRSTKKTSLNITDTAMADTLFLRGLLARANGHWDDASTRFREARELYEKDNNWLGVTSAIRWEGYNQYSKPDYIKAYPLIAESHALLEERVGLLDRIPETSESFDMMSRVCRQLAKTFRGKDADYEAIRLEVPSLPETVDKCHELARTFMERSKHAAYTSGDQFRIAESHLSYVIYACRDLEYGNSQSLKNIRDDYHAGIKIANDHNYNLLKNLFEKYMGNAIFLKRVDKTRAFVHYARRYATAYSIGSREKGRAIKDINNQIQQISDEECRDRCITQFVKEIRKISAEVLSQELLQPWRALILIQ